MQYVELELVGGENARLGCRPCLNDSNYISLRPHLVPVVHVSLLSVTSLVPYRFFFSLVQVKEGARTTEADFVDELNFVDVEHVS